MVWIYGWSFIFLDDQRPVASPPLDVKRNHLRRFTPRSMTGIRVAVMNRDLNQCLLLERDN
jgi:hypothetical protein